MKQTIPPSKRKYNQWVANETLEDFALRFTAKRARRWSSVRIANTALGVVSFLALEAIGAAITLQYGFVNSMWAILVVCALIFLFGLPICYHAAKSGLDIDLLTRGAGFGYIGSTISSLVYASFTFIFFALEAAIMSVALELLFGIPLGWAYVVSALVVIPLVTHGMTRISQFQLWTQPLWLLLQLIPLIFIVFNHAEAMTHWADFRGLTGEADNEFNLVLFGAASAVIFPLMAQNGEQVDFLRFLPPQKESPVKWWLALVISGPGWTIFGVLKLFIGSFLAVLALQHGVANHLVGDPTHMYLVAYSYVTDTPELALILVAVFVIVSQLKINVTNAYAGSLAWSNFFSRLTHNHPGRVVWLVFNVSIALLLMELGLYQAFESILITYSSLVLAWIGTIVADLVINRFLKLRPQQINFQRGHLYDINPVGLGSMIIAASLGIAGQMDVFGENFKALSSYIALFSPFIIAPLIACLTQGRYYLTDSAKTPFKEGESQCIICENSFEAEDMNHCPAYDNHICSLCCALDTSCQDRCRPNAHLGAQIYSLLNRLFPSYIVTQLHSTTGKFLAFLSITALIISSLFSLVYVSADFQTEALNIALSDTLFKLFFLLMIVTGILIWLYVLAQSSKQKAFEESQQRTIELSDEMKAHNKTFKQLQDAKETAINANQAKSRYLSGVSHELRTPLNTILGYAQLLEADQELDKKNKRAATAIRRGGEHLTDVIEGLLEISKIEARRLEFHTDQVQFKQMIQQLVEMFTIQAHSKGIQFSYICHDPLPNYVNTDEKRLRQILMNLLSNAVKFTPKGKVTLSLTYRNQVAKFAIKDTGIGLADDQQELIYEPFERILNKQTQSVSGTGLGLTISRLLANVMGGDISLKSKINEGSCFTFSIMLPVILQPEQFDIAEKSISAYAGEQKVILVVDDEPPHRQLMDDFLSPYGFSVLTASDADKAKKTYLKHTPDLILLDIQMPETNGWQLAEQLRKEGVNTPIIMLSGNAIESSSEQFNKNLHDAYFIKPVKLNVLLEKIGSILQLEWIYLDDKPSSKLSTNIESSFDSNITLPSSDELEELIAMAKIGYLNGVLEKLEALENNGIDAKLIQYLHAKAELCDFDNLVKTIEGLTHGA